MNWNVISEEEGLIIFERELGAQRIIGIFNTGEDQLTLSCPEEILLDQFMQIEDETMIIDNKGFVIAKSTMKSAIIKNKMRQDLLKQVLPHLG